MKHFLVIKEPVNDEIKEAFDHYQEQQEKLGDQLLDAIEEALKEITSHPLGYQIKYDSYRTKLVRPFPYILIYEIIGKDVVVYQFINAKKEPAKRIKK